MNEVMCWKVMGLCNILEQRSSLGDFSPNPSAACLYSLCHSRLVEAKAFNTGGGGWNLILGTTAQTHR